MDAFAVVSGRAQLWVECDGAGPPVAFLHAGVVDRRMWSGQMAALAPRFRVAAYDRRGFGRTAHADETYSLVGDLCAVLDAVAPAEPAILVGCSQGGRIAIDAALAVPGRVRALVLVAPAITGAQWPASFPPAVQALIDDMDAAEAANDRDRLNELEAHAWLDGPAAVRGRVGGPARALFLDMNRIALDAEERGTELPAPAAFDRVGLIVAPTLVIWGDLDFPHIQANCAHLGRTIPGARTLVLDGAAHLPNLESPRRFDAALAAFCESIVC
jgi:pimeloyl-ACP methyl ester carboxylesterase